MDTHHVMIMGFAGVKIFYDFLMSSCEKLKKIELCLIYTQIVRESSPDRFPRVHCLAKKELKISDFSLKSIINLFS